MACQRNPVAVATRKYSCGGHQRRIGLPEQGFCRMAFSFREMMKTANASLGQGALVCEKWSKNPLFPGYNRIFDHFSKTKRLITKTWFGASIHVWHVPQSRFLVARARGCAITDTCNRETMDFLIISHKLKHPASANGVSVMVQRNAVATREYFCGTQQRCIGLLEQEFCGKAFSLWEMMNTARASRWQGVLGCEKWSKDPLFPDCRCH